MQTFKDLQFKVGSDSSGNLKNRVDRILKESLGSRTPVKCSGIVFFSSLEFDPVLHDPGIIFFSKPFVLIAYRIAEIHNLLARVELIFLCMNAF